MNDERFHLVISKSMKKRQQKPNEAVHGTAARLRFGMNVKGPVWAAARDGQRSASSAVLETKSRGVFRTARRGS